ncbi:calcium-binding protein [Mameliella alba]|uniref:calcium-binding protein n=1 Tax=Mameliella alba TaxID=561184 RepID=UPI000B5330EE|nr:calcium-binding protein [Mameliella alba]MBY6121163.1 calcium-binding protein [Mameliella alba]OWV41536.1 type I secretion protein [Mameliella alba]OWV61532.1 type I secretion protein [Mameliella alba]
MIRILAALLVLYAGAALAQGRDSARVYVFGNSLVHHQSETSDHTNVPHWMNQMAKADGRSLALDGQWGFLRNFADSLPPTANWSFPGVQGAWSPGQGPFRDGRYDAVIATPANFIQYQLPDVPYDGDNPDGESPLGALQRIFDWVEVNSPDTRLFVYEGWSDMASFSRNFPPSNRQLRRYHDFNAGEYHQWYRDLLNVMSVTRPDTQVEVIPVASILAGFFQRGGLLEGLPAEALYTDNAPHGTPTLYMLAAMVTYAWIYDAPPPEGFSPPATLHPNVVANYAQLAEAIWQQVPQREATAPAPGDPPTEEARSPDLPERQPISLPPRGVRPQGAPALGIGLNGISDWSTQHPFLDLMKSSRGWVGNIGDRWGAVSTEELRAGGHLDEDDWPLRMPEGVDAIETVILTNQPRDAVSLRGDYVLTYDGKAEFKLVGRARRVRIEPGRMTFSYEPGEGLVALSITAIDAADPIRNIVILREEHEALYRAGALFNPDFLARIEDVRVLRFMDWMITNGSPVTGWDTRPTMATASWSEWGVPVEVMVRLANLVGADAWFNMPHLADDDYVRRFAEIVERDLDPRLRAYVELSNEVWNPGFPQAAWARGQAEALWGATDQGWAQFYGLRAAQVMNIWTEVFGEKTDRLVRVVATHTGWPGLEQEILQAPLAFLRLGHMPVDSFDAYAVTGYFGYEMGGEEMAQRMDGWLDAAADLAQDAGAAEGLQRVALREFVKDRQFEAAIAPVAEALEKGSLRQLVEEIFPYHAGVARKHDLRLIMYEGGTHLVGHGARVNDERLTAFFEVFSYTPEMARLYEILLAGWVDAGGVLFNAFVDVAPSSMWGSWGALRYLEDENPRWDMLMAYNASGPNGWEARDEAAFLNGVRLLGAEGRIQGTAQEDYLTGGPGDDVLVSGGGADVLNGGPGQDRVILSGERAGYEFTRENGTVLARADSGPVRMAGIEEVVFDAVPDTVIPLADLLR